MFPGFLSPALTQHFLLKPLPIFLIYIRDERRKSREKSIEPGASGSRVRYPVGRRGFFLYIINSLLTDFWGDRKIKEGKVVFQIEKSTFLVYAINFCQIDVQFAKLLCIIDSFDPIDYGRKKEKT